MSGRQFWLLLAAVLWGGLQRLPRRTHVLVYSRLPWPSHGLSWPAHGPLSAAHGLPWLVDGTCSLRHQAHHHWGEPAWDSEHSAPIFSVARRRRTTPCYHLAALGAGEPKLVVLILGSQHRPALLRDHSNNQLGGGVSITLGKFSFLYFIIFFSLFNFWICINNNKKCITKKTK